MSREILSVRCCTEDWEARIGVTTVWHPYTCQSVEFSVSRFNNYEGTRPISEDPGHLVVM